MSWCIQLIKLQLNYLFNRYGEALEHSAAAARHIRHVVGSFTTVSFSFYKALAALGLARTATGSERKIHLQRVHRVQRLLQRWTESNPTSCRNKLELVEAERRSILGDPTADSWYDRAIRSADEAAQDAEAGIACECAARHYLAAERNIIALAYLREALNRYARWGARAKVAQLENQYAALLGIRTARHTTTTSGSTTPLTQIALSSPTKALRVIAEERAYSGMVKAIIRTTLEFAAAQHGVLLLRDHRGKFFVQAEASIDHPETQSCNLFPWIAAARSATP